MVDASQPNGPGDPERALALSYAAPAIRPALEALFGLDDRLAAILRATRDPLVGQMRLTWWHQALVALDDGPAPAEPVLQALSTHVLPRVSGTMLATMVEGWETLLEPTLDEDALIGHAERRGGGLFAAMAIVSGAFDCDARFAGRGWAFADLAQHLSDPGLATKARTLAQAALDARPATRWPASARAIGALAQAAKMDLAAAPRPRGHPVRAMRLLWLRLTGR